MARLRLARKATSSTTASNQEMNSSPLPPPSTTSGEKRSGHDRGEERIAVKRAMVSGEASPESHCGRERLQRHRSQVAGRVWIPEVWGKEESLKDWTDCAALDRALLPKGLLSARSALIEECRRTTGSVGARIDLSSV